jgi:hypothetical protein
VALLGLGSGCGPNAQPIAAPAAEGLPEYTAEEAIIFDDSFSVAVFGAPVKLRPGDDPKLSERVESADAVVLSKIATVTSDRSRGPRNYQLVLRPVAPAVRGDTPEEPVTVSVTSTSPSYHFVASPDAVLVGRVVVLFFRRYNEEGIVKVHWHAEPATQEVREAIERTPTSR